MSGLRLRRPLSRRGHEHVRERGSRPAGRHLGPEPEIAQQAEEKRDRQRAQRTARGEREETAEAFDAERHGAAPAASGVERADHEVPTPGPRGRSEQRSLRLRRQLVEDIHDQHGVRLGELLAGGEVPELGREGEPSPGAARLTETRRAAVETQHGADEPRLEQRDPELATTASDIHHPAEIEPRGPRQDRPMHGVAAQLGSHVAPRRPAACAVAFRHPVEQRIRRALVGRPRRNAVGPALHAR